MNLCHDMEILTIFIVLFSRPYTKVWSLQTFFGFIEVKEGKHYG